MALIEGGFKRANIYACPNNSMKLPACNECKDQPFCLDRFTGVIDQKIIGITNYSEFDGVILFENPVDVTVEGWENQLSAEYLQAVTCHDVNGKNHNYEFGIMVSGSEDDGVFTLDHIGQTTVGSWVLEDETPLDTVRTCVCKMVCTYQTNVNGSVEPLQFEGNVYPFATGTYAYTDGDDAANQTAADLLLADAIATFDASGVDYQEITVEIDDCDKVLKLNVKVCGKLEATVGKKSFLKCDCCAEFLFEGDEMKKIAAKARLAANKAKKAAAKEVKK